eukprot:scaffold29532_cov67-Skeletonema_dohrnii-CCMP3373.AAC.1
MSAEDVLLEVSCNYTISLLIGATRVGYIGIITGRDDAVFWIDNGPVDFLPVSHGVFTHSHPL